MIDVTVRGESRDKTRANRRDIRHRLLGLCGLPSYCYASKLYSQYKLGAAICRIDAAADPGEN